MIGPKKYPGFNNTSVAIRPLFWALLAVCLVLIWQTATVWANYQGNWTALFCTGALKRIPPELQAERIYTFPNSNGYDGQFYHCIAHDPFLRRNLHKYIDEPGLRYRRILVPLLAWVLAAGQDKFVHIGFYTVILTAVFLGTYWLSTAALGSGRRPFWGLLFLLTPAVIISADRMLVDALLAALTIAFLTWSERPFSWQLWLVLACAALTRETGVILAVACCIAALIDKRPRKALLAASAIIPCAAWYAFVHARTPAFSYYPSHIPFSAIVYALVHPSTYPARVPFVWAVHLGDIAFICGAVLALVLCVSRWRLWLSSPAGIAALLFTAVGALIQRDELWIHLGRVLSPLLIVLTFEWIRSGAVLLLAPVLVMLPRVLLQQGNQVLGVLRALRG